MEDEFDYTPTMQDVAAPLWTGAQFLQMSVVEVIGAVDSLISDSVTAVSGSQSFWGDRSREPLTDGQQMLLCLGEYCTTGVALIAFLCTLGIFVSATMLYLRRGKSRYSYSTLPLELRLQKLPVQYLRKATQTLGRQKMADLSISLGINQNHLRIGERKCQGQISEVKDKSSAIKAKTVTPKIDTKRTHVIKAKTCAQPEDKDNTHVLKPIAPPDEKEKARACNPEQCAPEEPVRPVILQIDSRDSVDDSSFGAEISTAQKQQFYLAPNPGQPAIASSDGRRVPKENNQGRKMRGSFFANLGKPLGVSKSPKLLTSMNRSTRSAKLKAGIGSTGRTNSQMSLARMDHTLDSPRRRPNAGYPQSIQSLYATGRVMDWKEFFETLEQFHPKALKKNRKLRQAGIQPPSPATPKAKQGNKSKDFVCPPVSQKCFEVDRRIIVRSRSGREEKRTKEKQPSKPRKVNNQFIGPACGDGVFRPCKRSKAALNKGTKKISHQTEMCRLLEGKRVIEAFQREMKLETKDMGRSQNETRRGSDPRSRSGADLLGPWENTGNHNPRFHQGALHQLQNDQNISKEEKMPSKTSRHKELSPKYKASNDEGLENRHSASDAPQQRVANEEQRKRYNHPNVASQFKFSKANYKNSEADQKEEYIENSLSLVSAQRKTRSMTVKGKVCRICKDTLKRRRRVGKARDYKEAQRTPSNEWNGERIDEGLSSGRADLTLMEMDLGSMQMDRNPARNMRYYVQRNETEDGSMTLDGQELGELETDKKFSYELDDTARQTNTEDDVADVDELMNDLYNYRQSLKWKRIRPYRYAPYFSSGPGIAHEASNQSPEYYVKDTNKRTASNTHSSHQSSGEKNNGSPSRHDRFFLKVLNETEQLFESNKEKCPEPTEISPGFEVRASTPQMNEDLGSFKPVAPPDRRSDMEGSYPSGDLTRGLKTNVPAPVMTETFGKSNGHVRNWSSGGTQGRHEVPNVSKQEAVTVMKKINELPNVEFYGDEHVHLQDATRLKAWQTSLENDEVRTGLQTPKDSPSNIIDNLLRVTPKEQIQRPTFTTASSLPKELEFDVSGGFALEMENSQNLATEPTHFMSENCTFSSQAASKNCKHLSVPLTLKSDCQTFENKLRTNSIERSALPLSEPDLNTMLNKPGSQILGSSHLFADSTRYHIESGVDVHHSPGMRFDNIKEGSQENKVEQPNSEYGYTKPLDHKGNSKRMTSLATDYSQLSPFKCPSGYIEAVKRQMNTSVGVQTSPMLRPAWLKFRQRKSSSIIPKLQRERMLLHKAAKSCQRHMKFQRQLTKELANAQQHLVFSRFKPINEKEQPVVNVNGKFTQGQSCQSLQDQSSRPVWGTHKTGEDDIPSTRNGQSDIQAVKHTAEEMSLSKTMPGATSKESPTDQTVSLTNNRKKSMMIPLENNLIDLGDYNGRGQDVTLMNPSISREVPNATMEKTEENIASGNNKIMEQLQTEFSPKRRSPEVKPPHTVPVIKSESSPGQSRRSALQCVLRPMWHNANVEELNKRIERAMKLREELHRSKVTKTQTGTDSRGAEPHDFTGNRAGMPEEKAREVNSQIFGFTRDTLPDSADMDQQILASQQLQKVKAHTSQTHLLEEPGHRGHDFERMANAEQVKKDERDLINVEEVFGSGEIASSKERIDQEMSVQEQVVVQRTLVTTATSSTPHWSRAPPSENASGQSSGQKRASQCHKNSPPTKISKVENAPDSAGGPCGLVGELVQSLPQVPLSSFVEWFIETSDPKNFIHTDRSSSSSDKRDEANALKSNLAQHREKLMLPNDPSSSCVHTERLRVSHSTEQSTPVIKKSVKRNNLKTTPSITGDTQSSVTIGQVANTSAKSPGRKTGLGKKLKKSVTPKKGHRVVSSKRQSYRPYSTLSSTSEWSAPPLPRYNDEKTGNILTDNEIFDSKTFPKLAPMKNSAENCTTEVTNSSASVASSLPQNTSETFVIRSSPIFPRHKDKKDSTVPNATANSTQEENQNQDKSYQNGKSISPLNLHQMKGISGQNIRHILMKLRKTENTNLTPSQRNKKTRIMLRKSSGVTGIMAKFQQNALR